MADLRRLLLPENERRVLPAAIVLVAAIVFLPQLGSFGLWDPQEISVGDVARSADPAGLKQPPLTIWLIRASTRVLGTSEFAARLPLALAGILTLLATYALGVRLRGRRAGFF